MNAVRPPPAARRRIVVVDADAALAGLLGEWLAEHGDVVVQGIGEAERGAARGDLLVVDVAFPRLVAAGGLRRLAEAHAGTPLIALSPTFFPGIACDGGVARSLGVSAVLPKPVPRETLLATVRRLLASEAHAQPELR